MDIHGKSALLTGASGGIGEAIALALAQSGTRLLLAGRNAERLHALFQKLLPVSGGDHKIVPGDLSNPDYRSELVSEAMAFNVDILINNAGISNFSLIDDVTDNQLNLLMTTNVIAPISLSRRLLPYLLDKKESVIINIGSVFGTIGYPGFSAYCASKFALRGFTEALQREVTDKPVNVHYLAPRATDTMMNSQAVNKLNHALGTKTDQPEAVASAVLKLLLSNQSSSRCIGWPEKLFVRINSLLPGLVSHSLTKQLPLIRQYATTREGTK